MAGEKNFENKIKRFLDDNGCWFVKYFANRMTKSGVPDILACVNGRFVGIEVKATNGHPSELQIWNRDKIRGSNGICIVLYPEQWNEFVDLIHMLRENRLTDACELQFKFDERRKKRDKKTEV